MMPESVSTYAVCGFVVFAALFMLWAAAAFTPWRQAVIVELMVNQGERTRGKIVHAHTNCATKLPWRKRYYHEQVEFTAPVVADEGDEGDDDTVDGSADAGGDGDQTAVVAAAAAASGGDAAGDTATMTTYTAWSEQHSTWLATTVTHDRTGEEVEVIYNPNDPKFCVVPSSDGKVHLMQLIGGFSALLCIIVLCAVAYVVTGVIYY